MLKPWHGGGRVARLSGPCLGAALLLSSAPVSAAALGSLGSTAGLFAALMAVVVAKLWPGGGALSVVAVLALVAGGAMLRRGRGLSGAWLAARSSVRVKPAAPQRPPVLLPAGFEREELLATVRQHFVRLQAAWDTEDLVELQALTTADMLDELRAHLPERDPGVNQTDVLTLHAELLAFEEWASGHVVSIEFSGMIRERADQPAAPFREVWMLTRDKQADAAWRLARQQALL